jgi:hypothetical protein
VAVDYFIVLLPTTLFLGRALRERRGTERELQGILGVAGADLKRPLYIVQNKAAISFGMSELQFSGQNQAAMLLKTKAQCKSYSKLRCHALSMV